jgi:hypothetical protein
MTDEQKRVYISSPTGAGAAYANGPFGIGYFRGRGPRDGGQGRDCYIVAVELDPDGDLVVSAGGDGQTGYAIGDMAITVGCTNHVRDAITWISAKASRRKRIREMLAAKS